MKILKNKIHGLKAIWKFDNRYQLLLSRMLFRNKGLNVYQWQDMQILIDHDTGDESGTREVLTSTMYQRYLPLMKLSRPANILDIGANGGGFGLMFKINRIPLKKVVAVEFNPNTSRKLRFNLEQNLDCEVVALNAAAVGEKKILKIKTGKGSTADNIYSTMHSEMGREIEIEGVTIDELIEKYFKDEVLDVCKMDIEGAEHEVFAFPHHSMLKKAKYLIIEIHGNEQAKRENTLKCLHEMGFSEIGQEGKEEQDVYCFENKMA